MEIWLAGSEGMDNKIDTSLSLGIIHQIPSGIVERIHPFILVTGGRGDTTWVGGGG